MRDLPYLDRSGRSRDRRDHQFPLLSIYGLVYALPEELRAVLRSNNGTLPAINGDESWELSVPVTNVIARNGRVALAYLDVDYRNRAVALLSSSAATAIIALLPAVASLIAIPILGERLPR